MKDMVTNGTGNSRYLKSSLASGTSWADALAQLRAGTFPIDLNGLNEGGITQVGSAYSKANVLPQDVCTALGLTESTAEPKDAFLSLNNIANQHQWSVRSLVSPYSLKGDTFTANGDRHVYYQNKTSTSYTSSNWVKYQVANSVSVANDGTVSLVSPTTITIYKTSSSAGTGYDGLLGKYCKFSSSSDSDMKCSDTLKSVFFCPSSATFDLSSAKYIDVTGAQEVIGRSREYATKETMPSAYVNAQSSNAFPADGVSGSYWYSYIGLVGSSSHIAYGKYVGTGTYGSSNPSSITFPFSPRFVIIQEEGRGATFGLFIQPNSEGGSFWSDDSVWSTTVSGSDLSVTWNGFTLTYYTGSTGSAARQFNKSGVYYRYFALA